MTIHYFNPGKRFIGVILAVSAFSILAFFLLIIHWPQSNPFTLVRIKIPKGANVADVGMILYDNQIITNKQTFRIAVWSLRHEKHIPAGSYTLQNATTNFAIIDQLVNGAPDLKKITILEGWTMNKIAEEYEKSLGINADAFIDVCKNKKMLKKWNIVNDSFEGFLFPDTYYFPKNIEPKVIINTMVSEYRKCMSFSKKERARDIGLSETEIITLASIIEGEAIYDDERPIISGVYHNRLKIKMRLQADPTIQYIIEDGPRRLLNKDLKIKSPYNTYLNKGLPPGPINNPGRASINAALYPYENDYLYFVARGDGYHTFSRTQKEHNRAKSKFQRYRREVKQLIKPR